MPALAADHVFPVRIGWLLDCTPKALPAELASEAVTAIGGLHVSGLEAAAKVSAAGHCQPRWSGSILDKLFSVYYGVGI